MRVRPAVVVLIGVFVLGWSASVERPANPDVHQGRRADPLQELLAVPPAQRSGADAADDLRPGAAVGALDQVEGAQERDAAVGRRPVDARVQQRSPDERKGNLHDGVVGRCRRAEGQRCRPAGAAVVSGRLEVQPRARRGGEDAGRIQDRAALGIPDARLLRADSVDRRHEADPDVGSAAVEQGRRASHHREPGDVPAGHGSDRRPAVHHRRVGQEGAARSPHRAHHRTAAAGRIADPARAG